MTLACAEPGVNPELFYPDGWGPGSLQYVYEPGKAICARCDVREKCLTFALENDERFGLWGMLTPEERAQLKRRSA